MATSAAGLTNEEGRDRRSELVLLLLFWVFVFALSSARGMVANEIPFHLIAPHRAAVMGFGALLCWGMIHLLEAPQVRGFRSTLILGLAGPLILTALQTLFHMLSCRIAPIAGYPPITPPEALSSGMISLGYFTTWMWMHLALVYHRQSEAMPTPTPVVTDRGERRETSFWASRQRQTVCVREQDIAWVEAQRDYVMLHARGGGGLLRETLSALEDQLDAAKFIRVHRSAIVRRSEIRAIRRRPSGALAVTLASGEEVPVGRSYARSVRTLIEEMASAP